MKILIIDDSADFRALARTYLSRQLPEAVVTEYDVVNLGKPADDFNWSEYDVVLLDYNLGGGEDGFSWLSEFRRKPGFPPTVILTAEGDEYIAVKAIKLGAADYMNKVDISAKRLAEVVLGAMEYTGDEIARHERARKNDEDALHQIYRSKSADTKSTELQRGYKFVRLIGQGAMSKVYLAERLSDQKSLVLKIIRIVDATNEKSIRRFMREAELIAGLNSPFVVRIFDQGLTNNEGYIAMEFFPRGDLKHRMELKLVPEIVINYMTHIVYGLEAIHNIGIIHRDLKPANLMFRGDDSLALADFGISRRIDEDSDLTTAGQILGTPHYMSPEQGEGKSIDQRSDIYSAGVLFYELLTREKPYKANTPMALIYQHIHADIPRLPERFSQYQEIIDRTLAKRPEDRYQSARELIEVLEEEERKFAS